MKKSSKAFATLGVIVLFLIIMALIEGPKGPGGGPPGIIGIILFIGLIVAIRAIWKSNKPPTGTPRNSSNENDPYSLDKSE